MKKENNENNDIFKYIIYLLIFITFVSIAVNPSTRKFFSLLSNINKLEKQVETIRIENETYKKRLAKLKTNPREMEKAAKTNVGNPNIGVLAETEIEYIFNDSIDEKEEKSEI